MTRVVVHIGSQRIASDTIPRGLFANAELLAEHGVLVPKTARHELSPLAVRHHLLAWSFDPEGDHPFDPQIWETLADEVRSTAAQTVLLSSELLAGVAASDETRTALRDRLRELSDDVTLAFMARDQLGLLNSLYCNRVRALELFDDFDGYLEGTPDVFYCRLAESFGPWLDDPAVSFVAMPWDGRPDPEALPALLALCGVDVDPVDLLPVTAGQRDDLGAAGVEATRVLSAYLRGRFPQFSYGSPTVRRLRRKAAAMAEAYGWCTADFWGWTPARAARAVKECTPSNRAFAQRAWGGEWAVSAPVDTERHVLDLADLSPTDVNRLHHYLVETADAYEWIQRREASA